MRETGSGGSDTRMAGHTVSPGVFKSKDAEPEATLELFSDYVEVMERVFRLRRRIHPTTGDRIDFDNAEKKDLLIVEGGDDMQRLFKHVDPSALCATVGGSHEGAAS